MNWIHRLFHPHCIFCEENDKCKSCEILRQQLERANYENRQLFNRLFPNNAPDNIIEAEPERPQPIPSRHVPWNIKRQMLEQEERVKAKLMREAERRNDSSLTLEELEQEVLNKGGILMEKKDA